MNLRSPVTVSLALGILATIVGQLGGINPPDNYGFCSTCHGHDLVVGFVQTLNIQITSSNYPVVLWPLLTIVGVFLGSRITAKAHHEFRTVPIDHPLWTVLQGFLVISFALLALGCPIRMAVQLGELRIGALVGLFGVVVGSAFATLWIRTRS